MLRILMRIKVVILSMVFWMFFLGVLPECSALPIESKTTISALGMISRFQQAHGYLGSKEKIRKKLAALGIKHKQINQYLDRLTPEQIDSINLRLEEIKVGGDASGTILALLLCFVVVMTILYATNYTIKIEPKERAK